MWKNKKNQKKKKKKIPSRVKINWKNTYVVLMSNAIIYRTVFRVYVWRFKCDFLICNWCVHPKIGQILYLFVIKLRQSKLLLLAYAKHFSFLLQTKTKIVILFIQKRGDNFIVLFCCKNNFFSFDLWEIAAKIDKIGNFNIIMDEDDVDETTDIREQIFHNTVREQIVSSSNFFFYWIQVLMGQDHGLILFTPWLD